MATDRNPLHPARAWPLYAGMVVAAGAAVVASVSTLAALAEAAGWQGWTPWLLPASLDVGGAVGVWCWLRPGAPRQARDFGRWVALICAAASLVGNAAGHLIESQYLRPGAVLIVVVGAVPAAVLVALAHLAVLLTTTDPDPIGVADGTGSAGLPTADPAPDPTRTPTAAEVADPIGQGTRSESRSDRTRSTRSGSRSSAKRPARSADRSGTRSDPRTDDDLRLEVYAAIERGDLKPAPGSLVPGADPIRRLLHVHPDRARAIREELRLRAELATEQAEEGKPA